MPNMLKSFKLAPSEGNYLLTIEEEDGTASEVVVTYDQLDVIAEEVDRQLNADEEDALTVDGGEAGDG